MNTQDDHASSRSDTRDTRVLEVALEISRLLDERLGDNSFERHYCGVQVLLALLANEDPELIRSSLIGRPE